jgi:hypothetical protein
VTREPRRFTRGDLHDLVWSEPLKMLAWRFGLSVATLRAACTKADVPVPGPGHWTRSAGKEASRTALPSRAPGISEDVVLGSHGDASPPLCTAEDILRARAGDYVDPITFSFLGELDPSIVAEYLAEAEKRWKALRPISRDDDGDGGDQWS